MSFKDKIEAFIEARPGRGPTDWEIGVIDGARAALLILAEEHEAYLENKEPRSTIGPLFDAGLNTAAQALAKSCRARARELEAK